ncbi:MFS transporter [Sporosarcina obsidiansis]|uniref:MFS transporter n=1 Tax=Sporosarcina obsidiansis TaxID=2660748 RepID=UPI001891DC57|nr:MFS transporter [Sporosarcina obsidiansis]
MRWGILAFLFFGFLINYTDKSVTGFAAVSIMEEFSLDYSEWGLVGSSFFWFFSIAGVIGAAISDRVGTKVMLAILLMAWTILQLGAFAIAGLPLLVLYRIALGIFEGPFAPIAFSHLSKWFPPESRGTAIAIVNLGSTFGALMMAPVIVFIMVNGGWRTAFAFMGVLSLIWFLLWIWLGREKPQHNMSPNEQVAVVGKMKWSEVSPYVLSPSSIFTMLASFACFWIVVWNAVFLPSYIIKTWHFTEMQMSYVLAGIGIFSGLGGIGISFASDKLYGKYRSYRKARVYVGGTAMLLSALLLLSITLVHSIVWNIIALALVGSFIVSFLTIQPQIMMHLLPERRGFMASLGTSFQNLAGVIGPLVTGYLIQMAGSNESLGFSYSLQFSVVLLVVFGCLFVAFVKPDVPIRSKKESMNISLWTEDSI